MAARSYLSVVRSESGLREKDIAGIIPKADSENLIRSRGYLEKNIGTIVNYFKKVYGHKSQAIENIRYIMEQAVHGNYLLHSKPEIIVLEQPT